MPGNTANKTFTRAEREELRNRIWKLRNRGFTGWQIAKEVGISTRMVAGHMKIMELRWRKECAEGIAAHKEKALAQNEELFREYWTAWLRSLDEKTTTSTEKIDSDSGSKRKADAKKDQKDSGSWSKRKAAIKKEQKEGNPAFLAGAAKCIETRCKILGLNAPLNIDFSRMTTEDLIRLAQTVFGSGINDSGDAGAITSGPTPEGS